MDSGVQYAMLVLIQMMPPLFASNWDMMVTILITIFQRKKFYVLCIILL